MHRALFMADGPSDLPLATHLEALCLRTGIEISFVSFDPFRLSSSRTVQGRLRAALNEDPDFACIFVHRDAEGQDPQWRREEVAEGCVKAGHGGPVVPVVPVRMTEAWLLLDEQAIRRVAGKPSGTNDLDLPRLKEVESLADPKTRLRQVLVTAASPNRARQRKAFTKRFGEHRRQLLELLDIDGDVTRLDAWKQLKTDIQTLRTQLRS